MDVCIDIYEKRCFIEYLPSIYVFLFIAFFPFIYVCGYRWIYMRNDDPWMMHFFPMMIHRWMYVCIDVCMWIHEGGRYTASPIAFPSSYVELVDLG